MNNIAHLVENKNWNSIVNNFTNEELLNHLSFKELIILVYKMLYNDKWDEEIQNYAVDLLYSIREKQQEEWNSSWTYDSFLGTACDVVLRYDERYTAYKRAFEKANPVTPSLKILLAKCYISPGIPPISQEEAEKLLREALSEEQIVEGISLLKRICERKNDMEQVEVLDKKLQIAEEKKLHIHGVQPDFLRMHEL